MRNSTTSLSYMLLKVHYIWFQPHRKNQLRLFQIRAHEDKRLPGFRLLNWHFFFTAMLYVYGRILGQQKMHAVTPEKIFYKLATNFMKYQMVICYFLYIAGFMWFILTLKKKMYKYQFSQYAWTHMILIVVFTQSSFTAANIFEGIFWFLLPVSLIAINDVAAYFFGFFFGKTPLIKNSPRKTWEGFIGASVATVISAFFIANVLGHYQWLTCPRRDLSTSWLECDPGLFLSQKSLCYPQRELNGYHGKKAFKIKDFGGSIPGHGGFTDRMDCQMVMAVFAYIYHQSFVIPQYYPVEILMEQILRSLNLEEQELLFAKLKGVIDGRHLQH
ncbi:hypothetical protein L1987_79872 [Smallanthus sonchifolius]|uniref:Uncharacterized protein n=1 Tax=Smallanthus sonchifolius TaxID=185202 RepID=A0ACB8YML3_9ASTR|nr:hypothetical protein L1987_79872 [Smallanthus sonchifolius]